MLGMELSRRARALALLRMDYSKLFRMTSAINFDVTVKSRCRKKRPQIKKPIGLARRPKSELLYCNPPYCEIRPFGQRWTVTVPGWKLELRAIGIAGQSAVG